MTTIRCPACPKLSPIYIAILQYAIQHTNIARIIQVLLLVNSKGSFKFVQHWWDEHEVLTINCMVLKKICLKLGRVNLLKVNVTVEDKKHIYAIPNKHSYHDLSSIVMVLWNMLSSMKVVTVNDIMLKNLSLLWPWEKVKNYGKKHIYIILITLTII